ncbi:endonuclease/exonuclease/phosphatase family protein [Streptomyces sp. 135]|uniref:endonuclease/exonuclease/phosphatase family protein n=1 Tax=Streptomyces sp. 135 TaxID=2838850 RepID=UPI001CBD70F7|nr:endonuclease/exonuclease/phosphatase family protein [Streptomyces sp. 135]
MSTQTRTGSGCESGSDTCGLSTWRHHTSRRRTGQPGTWRHGTWRRGRLIATVAALSALVMALHAHVPNGYGSPGSLLQTLLPWTGLSAVVLLVLAVLRRSALAAVAVLVPALTWCSLFAGTLVDKRSDGGDLTVVSHNVNEENPHPGRTARQLAASGADVLALEELPRDCAGAYERELASAYRYSAVRGGVGLWSKYPLTAVKPVHIMPWTRALRATVETPEGRVALYAAHLASVRVHPSTGFATARRNEAAAKLAGALRAERLPRVVVVGDFNGSTDDRALRPLTAGLRSAQDEAGDGFGFTWPAALPVVRIDQILVRGVAAASSWTLPATASDHRPVAATLSL